jgi:hypothetical protein
MTADYDTFEWVFTAVVGAAAILIGGLVARPFSR